MTTHLTNAHLSGRTFSMARDYASMADWELEQFASSTLGVPGGTPPAARAELVRRRHAKTVANEWLLLEHNGFGM